MDAAAEAPAEAAERAAVRFAVDAEVCGALGCRETSGLLEVAVDGERRVLCADHAGRWGR
jgi:hypothetical protein